MDEKIDELCALTTKAHVLNVLHACRAGHPLGVGSNFKWRDAYGYVRQNFSLGFFEVRWLLEMALAEAKAHPYQ